MLQRDFYPGVKRSAYKPTHSPSPSADVKNARNSIPSLPHAFTACFLATKTRLFLPLPLLLILCSLRNAGLVYVASTDAG
jgi:hypothetical protein